MHSAAALHEQNRCAAGPPPALLHSRISASWLVCLFWPGGIWYEVFSLSNSSSLSLSLFPLQLIQTLKRLMRPCSVEFKSPLELSAQGESTTHHTHTHTRCIIDFLLSLRCMHHNMHMHRNTYIQHLYWYCVTGLTGTLAEC